MLDFYSSCHNLAFESSVRPLVVQVPRMNQTQCTHKKSPHNVYFSSLMAVDLLWDCPRCKVPEFIGQDLKYLKCKQGPSTRLGCFE